MSEIADLAKSATNNGDSNIVVLGKYNANNISYVNVAKDMNATYFELENWDIVSEEIGANNMWNINKEFINQQLKMEKTFYLSHNPTEATGYFEKEVDYLIECGITDFIKVGDNLWIAVK